MIDFWKLFTRDARREPPHDRSASDREGPPSTPAGLGLEAEYQALIAHEFQRAGISDRCASLEVRTLGRSPQGFDILVGMVRLQQWERPSALRLLLGLPLLEVRVRKLVRSTWLADYSHFGGLWLHASEKLQHGGHLGELKTLFHALVQPGEGAARQDPAGAGDTGTSPWPPKNP